MSNKCIKPSTHIPKNVKKPPCFFVIEVEREVSEVAVKDTILKLGSKL